MMKEYEHCKKYNNPFVLYTHYWELINNNETKDKIKSSQHTQCCAKSWK